MEISKKLTSKESFAILHEIESRKYPGGIKFSDWQEQREKRSWTQSKISYPKLDLAVRSAITRINERQQLLKLFLHARLRLLSIKPNV